VLTGHVVLRLTSTVSGTFVGQLTTHLASGEPFTTNSKAPLHVVSTSRRLIVTITGSRSRGAQSIAASIAAPLGRQTSQSVAKGRVVIHPGPGRTITLRTTTPAVSAQGAPTRLTVGVLVTGATGLPDCRTGSAGKLEIVDFDAIRNAVHTADSVKVVLPLGCGGTSVYSDTARGGSTVVKAGFH
jgi:hypothetical protein